MDESRVRELEEETRSLALAVSRLHRSLPNRKDLWAVGSQLNRAANSVAANHRAMSRACSPKDFAAKMSLVHQEADETVHWLGILKDSGSLVEPTVIAVVDKLLADATRLRNYFGHARATVRRRGS
jgi:four helix bundle protein